MIDVEGESNCIYAVAGYHPSELPGPTALAAALLGPMSVFLESPDSVCGHAELVFEGRWVVLVRRDLPPELRDFAIYHEIWEWWVKERWLDAGNWKQKEALCDAGAACLQLPQCAFREALNELGPDIEALAKDFRATQTAVALRRGEVTGLPSAVVFGRKNAWVRGGRGDWTPERARSALRTGLYPSRIITDAPNRVAVLPA